MRACGGLAGLLESSWSHADREQAAIADWAEVTWYLSGVDQVLTELDHLLPHPRLSAPDIDRSADAEAEHEQRDRQDRDMATIACRNLAHARCADLILGTRDDDALDALTAVIDAEADAGWRARLSRVRRGPCGRARRCTCLIRLCAGSARLLDMDTRLGRMRKRTTRTNSRSPVLVARDRPVPLQLRLRAGGGVGARGPG